MLRQFTAVLILSYFTFGTLFLPHGDFSSITQLPEMYRHCKSTEDKDMTPIDFITDHLINIDCLFDNHDHGDCQKPHSPFTFHHSTQQSFFNHYPFQWAFMNKSESGETQVRITSGFLSSEYVSRLFRPPII